MLTDAGTAVELALTRALETTIADKVASEALLEKYRMLDGRISLAKKYKIKLPATIEAKLLKPRNSVTHGYARPDRQTATDAFALAADPVRHMCR